MILSGKDASLDLYNKFENIEKKPKLVALCVGDNKASQTYLNIKKKALARLGFGFELIHMDENVLLDEVLIQIESLNRNIDVTGIIVQLPLPQQLQAETRKILDMVEPKKDADCLTTTNLGRFFSGETDLMPATAQGVIDLLDYYKIGVAGKNVVVIGRSNIVGKPLALALINENATVTICHSKTVNLSQFTKTADIVISAVGKAKFLTSEYFTNGQTIIDVGTSLDGNGKLSGDIDFENVSKIVDNITPVPGGVGPMTVYGLIKNLVKLSLA